MNADRHTPEQRSKNMSAVKSRNTKPEMLVRKILFKAGFRYTLTNKDLPGTPDIVLRKRKIAIFVHGCFWHSHGCKFSSLPKTNTEFWEAKLKINKERDLKTLADLEALKWEAIVIWGCELKNKSEEAVALLLNQLI